MFSIIKRLTAFLLIMLFMSDVFFSVTLLFVEDSRNQADIICLIEDLDPQADEKEPKEGKEVLKESKSKEGLFYALEPIRFAATSIRLNRSDRDVALYLSCHQSVPTPPPDLG